MSVTAFLLEAVSATAAAERALSCAYEISFNGYDYVVTCGPIRKGSIGEPVSEAKPEVGDQTFHIRPIEGVPVDHAIAVSVTVQQGGKTVPAGSGVWDHVRTCLCNGPGS